MNTKSALRGAVLISGALIGTGLAHAQTASSNDGAQATSGIEEVVVTAEKRAEKAENVPMQVDVLTPEDIEAQQIRQTVDIVATIPNFTIERTDTYSNSVIVLRGISQASNADQPVAVIVDGVPQDDAKQFNMHLFDISQIEVLKGPQGSIYGRSAEAGAVIINTRQPTNELSAFADISYGNGSTLDASAGLSGAIVPDKVLFRVAGDYFSTDGLIPNHYRGVDGDKVPYDWSLRGALIFNIDPKTTLNLIGQYEKYDAAGVYFAPVFSGNPNDVVNPQGNFPNRGHGSTANLTAKLDHDFEFATFTSITGYARLQQLQITDVDFTNPTDSVFPFQLGDNQPFSNSIFTQEFRLVSPNDQRFRWLLSADYLHSNQFINTHLFFDEGHPYSDPFNPALTLTENPAKNRRYNYGFSGQIDYDVLPNLTLSAGGRYDTDHRSQLNLLTSQLRKADFDAFQPKLTATYKFDNGLVYITYGEGFRSGGFNPPSFHIPLYRAEKLGNYEAGFKTHWLDRRLLINGAVFTGNVSNYQFSYIDFGTGSEVTGNIDKVRINGGELEIDAVPADNLNLFANLGVAVPDIRKFTLFPAFVGNETPRASNLSIDWGGDYTWELSDTLSMSLRADAQYYSKRYWYVDNLDIQKPKTYVNASLSFSDGAWTGRFWAKNIFNTRAYETYFPAQETGLPYDVGMPNKPAAYGIEILYKY